jgi:hypothetical protein
VADGAGLWLGGASGSGKTAAACLVVQRAREAGLRAEFWPVPELLVRLSRSRHDEDFDSHEEVLHEIGNGRVTIVTSDIPAEDLARMFGRRTVRRLQDMTRDVDCDWPAARRESHTSA